jgi:hypothetical protein
MAVMYPWRGEAMPDHSTLSVQLMVDDRQVPQGTRITKVATESLAECSLDRDY